MNCIATIVSANYLAYAVTLANSVKKYQPDVDFFVLIVDRPTEETQMAVAKAGINAVFAEKLDLPDYKHLTFKFNILELNTALKPSFLKLLFSKGYEKVIYLDPDIRLFSDFSPVLNALDDANITLTPHAQAPVLDGYRPSDIDYLRGGVFNLGFVGLKKSKAASDMLDWWEKRCLAYGYSDLLFGTFVDQKWMDLTPCYFDGVKILKHLGCNVAYWNLHERTVEKRNDRYEVGGEALCFFHFSGVKSDKPDTLSRYQTRHTLKPGTALAELVANYCAELNKNGHLEFSKMTYTFGSFDNGVQISDSMRRAACFDECAFEDPFKSSGPFYAKLKKTSLFSKQDVKISKQNTLNFDQNRKSVRIVNFGVRTLASLLGQDALLALLKYGSFLSRESNYARVLMKRPFDFVQEENGTRPQNRASSANKSHKV